MRKLLQSKLLLKILSGVIAVFLWFAITYTEDPVITQTIPNVPIVFEGESTLNENGFAIVNKDELPTISVTIRGSRSNVIASLDSIYATADVSKISHSGENSLDITYSYLSSGISLIKTKTTQLDLEIEKLVSREIPVRIETKNEDNDFEKIVEPVLKNQTIKISGAESTVYKISYAKATVDLSAIQKSSSQEYKYNFYGENDNIIPMDNIVRTNRASVLVESIVYDKTKLLPVKIVLDEGRKNNYGFLVKSIEKQNVLVGIKDNIPNIDHLEAVITSDDSQDNYTAKLIVPDGIYVSDDAKKITVSGEILPKVNREVTVKIYAENVPKGKIATVIPSEKTISVKTIDGDVKIKATVDAGNMQDNEEILDISFSSDTDADIIGEYNALVKLSVTGE